MRTAGIIAGITALVITVFSVYFTFFVDSPGDIVEKFFTAMDEGDINTVMSCTEPKYDKAYNAINNIAGAFLGFNIKDAADIIPLVLGNDFKPNGGNTKFDAEVISSHITGGRKLKEFTEKYGNKVEGIGNALGDKAEVVVSINNPSGGGKITEKIPLKKYDGYGWRIIIDSSKMLTSQAAKK